MNSNQKKATKRIGLLIFIVLLAMSMLIISLQFLKIDDVANAAVEDLAFTVEAGIYDYDSEVWTPYVDGDESQYNISFRFVFTGVYANPSITEFSFIEGNSYNAVAAGTAWQTHGEGNEFLKPENMALNDMLIWTYPTSESYDRYVKFRAFAQTTTGSGQPITEEYILDDVFHIKYDNTVLPSDIEISSYTASYKSGVNWSPYNTVYGNPSNIWVSTQIKFELTSKNMQLGGSIKEKFYYSIDSLLTDNPNKDWHPATNNVCILEQNLNGAIQFMVTDQSGMYKSYYTMDGAGLAIHVRMDIVEPEFEVRAVSTKVVNQQNVEFDYNSNLWSYNEIVYIITPTEKGESRVTYQYLLPGGEWTMLSQNTGGGAEFYTLSLNQTTTNIEFRASSEAQKTYRTPSRYHAYIDKQQPVVFITATDKENTKIKPFGTEDGDGYRVGYASDSLNFVIYNRNSEGEIIHNQSELYYWFKYTYIDAQGNAVETEYATMSKDTDTNGDIFYTYSDAIYDPTPINKRTYTFRLESRSGLYSEKSFTGSILYSDFSITIDVVSSIQNAKGWANAPIPVYINVPIMDKYTFAYGISGTGYEIFEKSFKWAADGSGDGDAIVKDVSEDFEGLQEGDPGFIAEGMAKFRIYLTTSVERRYFKIYAYNAAERKSKNEANTPELRLDLVTPNVKIDAMIQHSSIIINSGDWANGNILLTLDSKALPASQISLSGLDCELMIDRNIPEKVLTSMVDTDGLALGKFQHIVEIPEGQGSIFTKELMFRLTSGSGLQSYMYYDVKIDKREIILNSVYDMRNEKTLLIYNEETPYFTEITDPVCKDVTLNFNSNQNGHFKYWYRIDSTGVFTQGTGASLTVTIPLNAVGEKIVDFYLESFALDFQGIKKATNIYTIIIPFNCLSINITIALQEKAPEAEMNDENWRTGPLTILIDLPPGEEYSSYTYGVIILGDQTPEEFYAEKGLNESNQKSDIYQYSTPITLLDKTFDFWGVDRNGVPRFSDPSSDTTKCFYTGNMMVFAFNLAKYSSNPVPLYANAVRVDNSTPDVRDMIGPLNGEIEQNYVYNNETIILTNPQHTDRAATNYYYFLVTEAKPSPSNLPTTTALNGWTKLSPGDIVSIEHVESVESTSYYMFARNTLNQASSLSLNGEKYTFIVDTLVPLFEIDYPQGEGSDAPTAIDGDTYNIFTFTWTEEINIDFTTNSKTGVYYWYSIDNRETWIKYNENVLDEVKTTFRFSQDIYATMFFRLTNQAGSEVQHAKPAVVRIDTKRPDFNLQSYVLGSVYNGGDVGTTDINGSVHGYSLADTSGTWANSTVTITINIDPENSNPSPVQYQYLVISAEGSTQYAQTPSNQAVNGVITFTTDRMDNFGRNNDAIIVVQARCPANGKIYTQAIRIKVDKVVPEFKLNGEVFVSSTSNETKPLASGEWTNQEEVRISIQRTSLIENKSNVKIVYYRDGSSLENQWPMDTIEGTSYGLINSTKSETLRVVARTASGLTYQQVFEINIDTVPPQIESGSIVASVTNTPNTYYIDQPITYREENLKSAQYIVRVGETIGFPLSQGHIIATNTVDNSEDSKGYVKIIIEDLAGNKAELEFFMIPFQLNINNLTLTQEDLDTVDRYEEDLRGAKGIDDSRRAYFENLIIRLRDRENTLRQEISGFQSYLAGLSQKASYELKSDYREMHDYLETYRNYGIFNQAWIQRAIVEGEYNAYFLKLQEEYSKLDKEMARVVLVEDNTKKLPAINVVKVTDYNQVLQVYDAHLDLSPDQKSAFATNLYNKLITLKRKCENLLLQDIESGIKIEGNLAPGAKIEVTSYPNTVELFENAQATILYSVESDKPRTVVSVNKVSLTGAASQTSTGEIIVSLPIPEDYYNYVRFGVYRLSSDGSVTEVKGIEIQGDGKSVQFAANGLDTYVLTTKANIAVKEASTDVLGTFGDIEIDTKMLNYFAYTIIIVFTVLIVVVTITGLRRRRFLNHYNKVYKGSLYKKGVQNIPKGNKPPIENPFKDGERVKTPTKPIHRE